MRCADTVREGRSLVSLTDRNEVRMMFLTFSIVTRPRYWVYMGGGGYVMFREACPQRREFRIQQGTRRGQEPSEFGGWSWYTVGVE